MAKDVSMSLGDYWTTFIDQQVNSGRYKSVSEVIRESLRLLEEQQSGSKLEALRRALTDGEQSGPAQTYDPWQDLKKTWQNTHSAQRQFKIFKAFTNVNYIRFN